MQTSTSGLLLLMIGVAALAGFLTGNLDRWLGYLFDPTRPPLTGLGGAQGAGWTLGPATGPAGERRGGGFVAI